MTLALALGMASTVNAQEVPKLPDAGITPDSPFYFLDKLGDDMGMMFSFGDEAKITKQIQISQERLAEASQMQAEGNMAATEEALGEYNKNVKAAALDLAVAAKSGENFSQALNNLLATTNNVSQTVLGKVYTQVPEQAKSAIQSAMQASQGDMEGAMRLMQDEQLKRSQGIVDDTFQKARDNAPEAAKQYIPDNINVNDYVKPEDMQGSVDPQLQQQYQKGMEQANKEVQQATKAGNVGAEIKDVQVNMPEVKVPDVKVPSIKAGR